MSYKCKLVWTEQIYVFTTVEAEGEDWDPVKVA